MIVFRILFLLKYFYAMLIYNFNNKKEILNKKLISTKVFYLFVLIPKNEHLPATELILELII